MTIYWLFKLSKKKDIWMAGYEYAILQLVFELKTISFNGTQRTIQLHYKCKSIYIYSVRTFKITYNLLWIWNWIVSSIWSRRKLSLTRWLFLGCSLRIFYCQRIWRHIWIRIGKMNCSGIVRRSGIGRKSVHLPFPLAPLSKPKLKNIQIDINLPVHLQIA